jgi:hypothetical protein
MVLMPGCLTPGRMMQTAGHLRNGARTTVTTFGSPFHPKMRLGCQTCGPLPGLVRGRADDGKDLVISRDYISRGLRARAADRVTLELGPRSDREVSSALEKEVEAERWTGLDRVLRAAADEGGGVADLRPGSRDEDPELRRLMVGRTAKLEWLGLADQVFPGCWTFQPSLEQTLRDLSIRGDIIKTMHRALVSAGREPEVSGFALHGDRVTDQVLGRLVERGLHDELRGSAYAIVDGIDGRTHHLQFSTLEMTSDAKVGAIVEARAYQDDKGHDRLSLAVRSDLTLQEQVAAPGATWLDRQLLSRDTALGSGFGTEVQDAMDRRIEHLVAEGLVRRQGQQTVYAGDLLATLRRRELDQVASKLSAETGLSYQPLAEGERVVGVYRQQVVLSSGRFAMIDDGLGFQLVPWRPALERHINEYVAGVILPGGRVDWSFGRKRGLSL